jgi:neutral ceramidase
MARSHIAVTVGAAVVVSLIIGHLLLSWVSPSVDFWHSTLDQSYNGAQPWHLNGEKQGGELADDPASYLIGVGKADITG